MATRIRTIKPEFFKHSGLYDLEKQSKLPLRLAFAGLWTVCDREGRFRWRARELKTDVLPHDDLDFAFVLEWLRRGKFIRQYEVEGELFGCVPSWHDHQRMNPKESKSALPAPPAETDPQVELPLIVQNAEEISENGSRLPKTITEQNQQLDAWADLGNPIRGEVEGEGEREVEREREGGGRAATRQIKTPPQVTIPAVTLDSETPRDLTELEYARSMLETLGMPTRGNLVVVAESIKAFSLNRQTSLPAAFEQMRAIALDARDRGDPINSFWFQDARYLMPPRKSKSETATEDYRDRFDRELAILHRTNVASA